MTDYASVPREYRKKPVVITASQWFKHGDHPNVRKPLNDGELAQEFGVIDTLEGDKHYVSPGDWIICGVKGEHYACKPDIFEQTYEVAAPAAPAAPDSGMPNYPAIFIGAPSHAGLRVEGEFVTKHCYDMLADYALKLSAVKAVLKLAADGYKQDLDALAAQVRELKQDAERLKSERNLLQDEIRGYATEPNPRARTIPYKATYELLREAVEGSLEDDPEDSPFTLLVNAITRVDKMIDTPDAPSTSPALAARSKP